MAQGWLRDPLDEFAYRPAHTDRLSLQAEQDNASNGNRSLVIAEDQKATGRVKLVRKRHARRLYAVLVWDHSRRFELPIGEVTSPSRAENLRRAWALVHREQLLTPDGRARWTSTPRGQRPIPQ